MKLVLHLLKKDIRHLRFFLMAWWAVLILRASVISSSLINQTEAEGTFLSEYWLEMSVETLGWCTFLALLALVRRLVQSDSIGNSNAFWLSRPVSAGRLLLSKSLFLVLTVILPKLLVEAWVLRSCGVTQLDLLRSIPQIVFLSLPVPATIVMLFALDDGRKQKTVTTWLPTVAVSLLGSVWILWSMALELTYESLSTSRSIVLILLLLVFEGFVIWHQYATRRTKRSAIFAISGIFLCGLALHVWNWDFVAAGKRPNGSVIDPQRITARIEEKSLYLDQPVYPGSKEIGSLVLKGIIALENIPEGLVVVPEQIVAQASFQPTGHRVFQELRNHDIVENERFWLGGSPTRMDTGRGKALEDALGGVNFMDAYHVDADRFFRPYIPELLAISKDTYRRYGGSGAVYSAKVGFLVQREEFAALRLEKGEHYDQGSDHAEILGVRVGNGSLTVELRESQHSIVLDHYRSRRYLLHNRSKREVLLGDDRTFSGIETLSMWKHFPPMLKIYRSTLSFALPRSDPPLDPNWFEGAELVQINTRNLGRFFKTIRMENLVLKDIPGP